MATRTATKAAPEARRPTQQRGVASVEIASSILNAIHAAKSPQGLSAIAGSSGLAPSRVHHYLVSLAKTGLVHRERVSGLYSLGPFAIRLGLTAVDRLEVQHFSAPFLHEASVETGEASFFSVWSDGGPVIVRWEQGAKPLTVFARLGTVMPLLASATGEVYCAWGPQPAVSELIARELRAHPPTEREARRRKLERAVRRVRRLGFGATTGAMIRDVNAVAAPVFGRGETLAGVITILGLSRGFDVAPDAKPASAVRSAAVRLSRKLAPDIA